MGLATAQGQPTKQLVEFMVDEFVLAMQAQNTAGQNPQFNIEAMVGQLSTFRDFAREYLTTYRPQQFVTNMDANYGVQLTNGKFFVVATPLPEIQGTMQPTQHVHVTGQQTIRDMQAAGAIPVTGAPNLIPPGLVDFSKPQDARDMTQTQPMVRYDQQHPAVPAR